MKKITKIISFILIMSMLVCAFAACKDDSDGDTDESVSSSSSSSSKSSSSQQSQTTHKVTLKDGLTGAVLEVATVPDGRGAASFLGHYDELHYGYKLNKEKETSDYTAKIVEDTTITLEYTLRTVYTIYLQDVYGDVIDFETPYVFKKALTRKQMGTASAPGLNGYDEPYVFGNNKTLAGAESTDGRNDFTTEDNYNCIKVYEGYTIEFDDIPAAPAIFNGDFLMWEAVEGYKADFSDGTIVENSYFNGAGVTADMVIRAKYTENGTGAMANAELAKLASTPETVFQNLLGKLETRGAQGEADAYYDATYKNGHERLKYGDEKDYITNDSNTTFRFASGMGTFMYAPNAEHQSADPVINKFNGTEAAAQIHVDQNTYIAFDGTYMYAFIVVRDDTPVYLQDEDAQVFQMKIDDGQNMASDWSISDNIEIRYSMNVNNKYTDIPIDKKFSQPVFDPETGVYSGGSADLSSKADKGGMRTMRIDRAGITEYVLDDFEGDVKQSQFVEQIDLAPADDTRMTAKLTNSENKENGYAIGLRFNIAGYIEAINSDENPDNDFSWNTLKGENTNYFGMAFFIQVNDRTEEIRRADGNGGYEASTYYDVSGGASKDCQRVEGYKHATYGAGVQHALDEIAIFRLAQPIPTE